MAKDTRNTARAVSTGRGAKTTNAPRPVATPFPPLKPIHGEKTWPATAARAVSAVTGVPSSSTTAASTGSAPFATSRRSPSIPASLPQARNRLVAPMLPDPTFLRSTPRDFAMTWDHGTEPDRKAATGTRTAYKD